MEGVRRNIYIKTAEILEDIERCAEGEDRSFSAYLVMCHNRYQGGSDLVVPMKPRVVRAKLEGAVVAQDFDTGEVTKIPQAQYERPTEGQDWRKQIKSYSKTTQAGEGRRGGK